VNRLPVQSWKGFNMLRVERFKPNIFCVCGVQFKPGITEVSEPDATRLMNTRQFMGSIQNGDMVILDCRYEVQPEPVVENKSKPKRKSSVSQKTTIKIVNSCSSVEELEGMLKSQKDKVVQQAIKDRIADLTPDINVDTE